MTNFEEIETGICSVKVFQDSQYIDWGDFTYKACYNRRSNIPSWVNISSDGLKIVKGDRIVINHRVYDVENNIDGAIKVVENIIESSLLKLEDMGVPISEGIAVPVKSPLKPEDEHFIDTWVGVWVKNICKNYDKICEGETINILRKKCENTSAVIVGAGPSLDKNINELKNINAIIIALDRAYKPLLARGINPDLVVSLDCHDDIVLSYLDKVDSSKHILVMNTAEDYNICRMWKGRILYYNMSHDGIQFCDIVLPYIFPKFPAIINLGCVANTAIILADWMGCSTSILVGCDFSYPDKKLSCDEYDFIEGKFEKKEIDEEERFEKRSGKILVRGIYTYPPFVDYLNSMKKLKERSKFNLINATEGGIIDCFPCISLREAKEKYCLEDISKVRESLNRRQ